MARIVLLRHFITDWNRQERIQGRTDQPLSDDAADNLVGKRLHNELANLTWYTSPLKRTIQTADLLGIADARRDERLIEMDWGTWEGQRLKDLRAAQGDAMVRNEAQGLDFRPTGGESPRDVRDRVIPWLRDVEGRDVAAVTHKGVIRAVLSWALGWNMTSKAPVRLDWTCAQIFAFDGEGNFDLLRANQPLLQPDQGPQ